MKLLLDENFPEQLLNDFPEHTIFSVGQKNWKGKKNGELLKLLLAEEFQVLITADKNLRYQQNFSKYPIPVVVLNVKRITYPQLKPLVPQINKILTERIKIGSIILTVS